MSVLSTTPVTHDSPEAFLGELFAHLAIYRTFPKFQFERRASDLIALFLPEIVRARYSWDAEVIAPEFPLKKDDDTKSGKKNNQSTNADYLLRIVRHDNEATKWVLVELKTDAGSVDIEQLQIYLRTLATKSMHELEKDVQVIAKASRAKKRYQLLRDRLKLYSPNGQLELLYLVPNDKVRDILEAEVKQSLYRPVVGDRVHILTFAEICNLRVQRYPSVWDLLCEKLLGPLSEASTAKV